MVTVVKKTAAIVSINDITDTMQVGIMLGTKKYIVISDQTKYRLMNEHLITAFNHSYSQLYITKRQLVNSILSQNYKDTVTVFRCSSKKEILNWLAST